VEAHRWNERDAPLQDQHLPILDQYGVDVAVQPEMTH